MTTENTATPHRHVVIVGGGFGGLAAARRLGRRRGVRVTLVDRRNHHLFQPLLYQVAMAGLSPADISAPIRRVLRRARNVTVWLAHAHGVDVEGARVLTDRGTLAYDYLILACGATHSYFGHDAWEAHAPGLKTVEQALEIRRRILTAFERAELEPDAGRRKELMTFVVVGGGPTGVELAGSLGEISRHTLSRDFRHVDPSTARIMLVEGGPRILPGFHPDLGRAATRTLEKLGVTIWTDSMVTGIDARGVQIGDEALRASTVLWAAGVRAARLGETLGVELDPAGRVPVEADLTLAGRPEVFVIGDQARVEGADGQPVPGLAPAALQQGRAAADNVLADLAGRPRRPFRYRDKGMMATIGRAAAVAQRRRLRLRGFLAWLAWCLVHIVYLIGFRNRILVLVQWMWSYFRFKRGARLITRRGWQLDQLERGADAAGTEPGDARDGPPAQVPVDSDREQRRLAR